MTKVNMTDGRQVNLENGGSVWVSNGLVEAISGVSGRAILFTNEDGVETKTILSEDALQALETLRRPDPLAVSMPNMIWRVVEHMAFGAKDEPSVSAQSETGKSDE